jgi:hypothetical protein
MQENSSLATGSPKIVASKSGEDVASKSGEDVASKSGEDVASIPFALKQCSLHEKEMDEMMTEIIKSSKTNYRFKASANVILVIIGTILIATPIAFTWLKSTGVIQLSDDSSNPVMNLTNLNYFLGGIGIVAFVTSFYNKPQSKMTIAIADLAQLFVICNMYRVQFSVIRETLEQEYNKKPHEEKNIDHIRQDLSRMTEKTAELIDKYIETHARSDDVNNGSDEVSRLLRKFRSRKEDDVTEKSIQP